MSAQSANSMQWEDIVFENRNKEYGAYSLRKKYGLHIILGIIFTAATVALVLGFPTIIKLFKSAPEVSKEPIRTVKYTDLAPPPPIDKNIPPPPKLNVPPPVKTIIKYLPPKVTDKEIVEEEKMPTIEEIKNNETGAENVEGTGDVVFDEPVQEVVDEGPGDQVFTVVEQMPEFEGGYESMFKFIQKHLRYPASAKRMGVEGTVYVSFVVDTEGKISEVQAIKSLQADCDKEAIRVVSMMPPWKPGKQNGKAVKVRFVLPLKFKLST